MAAYKMKTHILPMAMTLALMATSGFQVTTNEQNVQVTSGAHAANVKDTRPKRKTPLITARVFKKIEEAQNALKAEDFATGMAILAELKERGDNGKLNSYEIAQLWNMYAFTYFSQEKYADAITAYENILKQKNIPWALEDSTNYSLSQLYFLNQDLPKALKYIDNWLASVPNPNPQGFVFKAQIHYQEKDLANAFINVKKGVDLADQKKTAVKESWLQLLGYLYYEKKDIKNSIKTLERLVAMNPKKAFVTQLSGMYMENDRSADQVTLYRGLYEKNLLTDEKELITLASLYINEGVPVKAGQILEKGFKDEIIKPTTKNLELLGNAWYRAQELEKSIIWLEKAAKQSDEGKIHFRLAAVYLDLERFKQSVSSAKKAIELGGMDKPVNAFIILASAQFYLKEYEQSLSSFGKVLEIDDENKVAKQWIKYVTTEKHKQEEFKAFINS